MTRLPDNITIYFDSSGYAPPLASEKQASKELQQLIKRHNIDWSKAEAVEEETYKHPRVRKETSGQIISYDLFSDPKEQQLFRNVKQLIFGSRTRLERNEQNDIRILVNAWKYHCSHFVTYDIKHILKNSDKIKQLLGYVTLKPSECLVIVQEYLSRYL